jgi:hypothetical protein
MVHALRVRDGKVRASGVHGLLLAPGASNKMAAPNKLLNFEISNYLPNFIPFGSII